MVIIDAYRGGNDTGISKNGILEKDYNLKLSRYIYNKLKAAGVDTILTRDGDITLNLDDRVKKINNLIKSNNDIVISISLNSSINNVEIIYPLKYSSTLAGDIANNLEGIGMKVSDYYQKRLPSDTKLDYYELIRRISNNQVVIIYPGNINNENEAKFLNNNLSLIGDAIVSSLLNYLNINNTINNSENIYTVVAGDTLYAIAKKYNTTVDKIKILNNLTSNSLSIGKKLKIPSNNMESGSGTYTVVSGDTLYSIAKKYNTTVDKIKTLNNLTSNSLSIGMKLKIPDTNTYTVVSGDTLYSIAKKYNTTVDKIKDLNNLTSNILKIGTLLKIPS